MATSCSDQPSMVQRHENGSNFSQSNSECINLISQNSIGMQGSYQALSLDVNAPFHSPNSRKIHRSRQYVKWGIAWQPLWFMILLVLCGYALAIGHHLYFSSLDNTVAGSPLRQQWAIRFGTIFAYGTASLLAAAIGAAYEQHLWTLFRQNSFSLNGLDDLFALKSTPTGFFNVELLAHAKLAVLLALCYWLVALAAIAPPATLSVVLGISIERQPAEVPTIDWSSEGFYYPRFDPIARPTAELSALTMAAAESMDILPHDPPVDNSSYYLQFWGPTIRCPPSTNVQKQFFNNFIASFPNDTITPYLLSILGTITTESRSYSYEPGFSMLVFSAFTPLFADFDFLGYSHNRKNLWLLPSNLSAYSKPNIQLWVQTSRNNFVCSLGNTSYEVVFDVENGNQTITSLQTIGFEPVLMDSHADDFNDFNVYPYTEHDSYIASFVALCNLLVGNITVLEEVFEASGKLLIDESSSLMLRSGLDACEDITNSLWRDVLVRGITIDCDKMRVVNSSCNSTRSIVWSNSSTSEQYSQPINATSRIFGKPQFMCRNRTLDRAIEDLYQNITISMLSATQLTKLKYVNVTSRRSTNIYQYNSRNLILSYSIAAFIAFISIIIGILSCISNGVAHSTAFSALVATTRNPELDALSKGHCMGSLPLDKEMAKTRLRFGELEKGAVKEMAGMDGSVEVKHLGFGFEEDVVRLRKGGVYI